MTLYSGGESPAEFVARMRAEHGLDPKCSDAAVLGRIARELVEGRSALRTNENGTSATEPRSRTTTDRPSPKEAINAKTT